MSVTLNPYLSFRDTAREAMTFYHEVFGGELNVSTFGEMQASEDPAEADKIMHAQLDGAAGITLMGADTPNVMPLADDSAVAVSLSGEDEGLLRGFWEKLSTDATDVLPLERAPWGDYFGMCSDRFGVRWLVNITGAPPAQ